MVVEKKLFFYFVCLCVFDALHFVVDEHKERKNDAFVYLFFFFRKLKWNDFATNLCYHTFTKVIFFFGFLLLDVVNTMMICKCE